MNLRERASAPVDAASLQIFRLGLGVMIAVVGLRFFAHGWIRAYYVEPAHFFHYWGFSWVRPWPGIGMYVHYALMFACGVLVALGRAYRPAMAAACVLFSYAHFSDKTNYLNHYYFVSCLTFVCACLPLGRSRDSVPALALWIVRFQVGVVYFGGGLAKLGADWLGHAQPLTIWLGANTDFPVLGALFGNKSVAYAFSWAGAAFDLSVVPLLLVRRTRPYAYGVLVVFHLVTAKLFPIGVFPWLMIAVATVFFEPDWPRRAAGFRRLVAQPSAAKTFGVPRIALFGAAAWMLLHIAMPLRSFAYRGNTLWTEQGFRFAWKVMVMEKSGTVELRVVDRATGQVMLVQPKEYLSRTQIKQMATQPDMILEFAHLVRDQERARGRDVAVYADSWVSLNGRPAARLVRPEVDLGPIEDSLAPAAWIAPPPPPLSY